MLLVEAAVAAEMQPPAMDAGLVRKAMAFRVKYRLDGRKKQISLSRLGVHPQNRGGMYPQPDVVRNLGLNIITKGFNKSEADHEGVSVEEIPCSERAAHSRSDGSPYEPYGDYNIRQCDHKYLVECFSQLHDIMYGTLSHSRLLLVLLSWLNGADWKIDDEPTAAYGNHPPRKCVGCGTPSEGVWECGWCIRPLCSVHCARAHEPLCRNRDPLAHSPFARRRASV